MAEYDKIAKIYFEKRQNTKNFDYNKHIEIPAMLKMVGQVRNKVILDMGCGFGDHADYLIKKGAKKVTGFDLSKKLIDIATNRKINNTEFYVGDMSKRLKHKDNSFDIVISSLAVHYIKDLKKLFNEIKRVLKRNGCFIFSTQHPIFNTINTSEKKLVGIEKIGGKEKILGNYFDESLRKYNMGSDIGFLHLHPYTTETIIKAILSNDLVLIDYVDAKPVKISKKIDLKKYIKTSTLPTFVVYKVKKK